LNTDRWYYRVFQSAPDLIRLLLPGPTPMAREVVLDPGEPGDRLYRFSALELKELSHRLDLDTVVLPMLVQRFPAMTEEQIMVIAGIPREEIRHTRAVQDWLAEGRQEGLEEGLQEGRQEGRQEEAANLALRQLARRCGPLIEATTARIQALPLERLEALADALLDFRGAADLDAWLAQHAG
jgi:hypothetical protein